MGTTVKGATVKIGGDTTGLENALKSTNKEIGHIGTELKTVERLLKLDPGNVILVAQKQELLTKSIEETTKKLNNLRESQEKVEQQAAKGDIGQEQFRAFQREIEKTRLKLDDLEEEKKSFDAIADSTDKATKSIINLEDESKSLSDMSTHFEKAETKVKSLNNQLPNTHKGMENIGKAASATMKVIATAIVALSTAMVAAGGFGIKVGMDFEEGMSSVASISGATGDELDRLTEKAKQMGADTKFSATQSAQAFEYMAMAGWKTGDMLSGIEGVMNLAAASGEELGLVSDIVTDSLTAFGLQAKDSARFSDVLAKASSASNTNVALMGNTFQYVAPLAGAMGYSIEDTAVAIGLMANSGIKGEKAGTALQGMLTRLMAPTSDVSGAMDELGISILNTDGTVKPLNQTMVELRGKFANLTDAEQAQYAATLAGKEAMSGFLSIVNASEGNFQKLTTEINNSSGAAQTMADIRMDNLKGDIDKLKSATEGLGIQFYESIDNGLRGAVQAGTKSIDELAEAFESGGLEGAIDKAGEIIGDFVTEIASQAPGMVRSATKLIKAFVGSIKENKTELVRAGKDIVISLADGIGDIVPVLKPVTSAIGFLAENFDTLLKIAVPLTVAFVAYNAALKVSMIIQTISQMWTIGATAINAVRGGVTLAAAAQTALTTAQGAGIITTTAATAAQTALNAAMAMNPVGLAIVAIAALGVGIGLLINHYKESTDEVKKFVAETDTLISKSKNLNDEISNSAKVGKENTEKLESEAAASKKLSTELFKLADKEKKSNAEKAIMKTFVDELNQKIPNLALEINNETGELNMQKDTIDNLITSNLELTKTKAAQQRLIDITTQLTNAEMDLYKLEQQRTTALAELDTATKTVTDSTHWYDGSIFGAISNSIAMDNATGGYKDKLTELDAQIATTKQSQETLALDYQSTTGFIEENSQKTTELTAEQKALAEQAPQTGTALDGTGEAVERLIVGSQDLTDVLDKTGLKAEEVEKKYDSYADKTLEAFKKIEDGTKVSVDEMIKNIQANSATVKEWSDNLGVLADKGVNEGLIATLRNAGPEISSTVAGLVAASDTELSKLNEVYQNGSKVAVDAMLTELGLQRVKDGGTKVVDDVASGVTENKALETSAKTLIEDTKKVIVDTITTSSFSSVGKQISEGLKEGILSGKSLVIDAAVKVATDSYEAAKNALEVASPSKKFMYLGKMSTEGLAIGVTENKKQVLDSFGSISNGADKIFKDMSRSFATMPLAAPTNFPTPRTAAAYIPTMQRTGNRQAPTAPPTIAHITIELNRRVLGEIMTPIISQNINANTATDRRSRGSK